MYNTILFTEGFLANEAHRQDMLAMLDHYMQDPMGKSAPLKPELAEEIIAGLEKQPNFKFFLAYLNGQCVAMANCFVNFSTFKAMPLLNIHDFVVHQSCRGQKVGEQFMNKIADYCKDAGYCRINLEVRHDNPSAMQLYKKTGFVECIPPMFFWEKNLW